MESIKRKISITGINKIYFIKIISGSIKHVKKIIRVDKPGYFVKIYDLHCRGCYGS